jgi:hypothetical protein
MAEKMWGKQESKRDSYYDRKDALQVEAEVTRTRTLLTA